MPARLRTPSLSMVPASRVVPGNLSLGPTPMCVLELAAQIDASATDALTIPLASSSHPLNVGPVAFPISARNLAAPAVVVATKAGVVAVSFERSINYVIHPPLRSSTLENDFVP